MSQPIDIQGADRKVFRAAYDDGLWDIFLGCFLLMFVIAPYLSASLGDFWSSVVFLPFWGLVYLGLRLVRKHLVIPRIGIVKFGPTRKSRLKKLTLVMLVMNGLAFVLGLAAALSFSRVPGQLISIIFGLILLAGFSLAAFFLEVPRLYMYGLLAGFSPPFGEWLFQRGYASHHGFPITFGMIALIMFLTGLGLLIRLLGKDPVSSEGISPGGA